jgi:hypothetical protein
MGSLHGCEETVAITGVGRYILSKPFWRSETIGTLGVGKLYFNQQ